ncbi:MAG: hypothetical protein IJ711_13355, partial [Lachnospiraceae bacterium]|nr:hypothetical protein [Lachnospiraceae bacterium]
MLHGPLGGQMADFTYDCRNRLVKVETEDGETTSYEYDAENIRITAVTETDKRTFVTDREATFSQLLEEHIYEKKLLGIYTETGSKTYTYGTGLLSEHGNGSAVTDYAAGTDTGIDTDEDINTDAEETRETKEAQTGESAFRTLYYHFNNIGSTTELTEESGKVVYRFAYGAYGELTGIADSEGMSLFDTESFKASFTDKQELLAALQSDLTDVLGKTGIRFLYNGELGVQTEINGLYYMRARYYNSDIKRFINRDVINGSITDSQSLNKYSYVQGNPISLTDPFGLCAYDRFSEAGHEALDWAGWVFDAADGINCVWYLLEGNKTMAAVSAFAMLPGLGSGAAKGAKAGIKGAKTAVKTTKGSKLLKKGVKLTKKVAEKG